MATITLRQASRLGNYKRPWVARITGSDPTYHLKREFLEPTTKRYGGQWTFELADGLYELCDRNSKGAERRSYACVSAGILQEYLSDEIFAEHLAAMDAANRVPAGTPTAAGICSTNSQNGASAAAEPFECLECGYQTEHAHEIDAGGMGCVRCNH